MSVSGLGNIHVDHASLIRAAQELVELRESLMDQCIACRNEMERVSTVMQSLAGQNIVERFNNLGTKYFGEYAQSMLEHAEYLGLAAERYAETDEALKAKSQSALVHFDDV